MDLQAVHLLMVHTSRRPKQSLAGELWGGRRRHRANRAALPFCNKLAGSCRHLLRWYLGVVPVPEPRFSFNPAVSVRKLLFRALSKSLPGSGFVAMEGGVWSSARGSNCGVLTRLTTLQVNLKKTSFVLLFHRGPWYCKYRSESYLINLIHCMSDPSTLYKVSDPWPWFPFITARAYKIAAIFWTLACYTLHKSSAC